MARMLGNLGNDGGGEQFTKRKATRHEKARFLATTNKRITLNVSGVRFETYEETLNSFPETLLGSSEKREEFFNHRTQEYCLPRRKCAFDSILFYYQSHGILARPDTVSVEEFDDELLFYQINNPDSLTTLMGDDEEQNPQMPVACTFRERVWMILEYPMCSPLGQLIAIVTVLLIVFSIVIFTVETLESMRKQSYKDLWFTLETICIVWFIGEYICRVYAAPVRRKFIFSGMGMVDLLAILPYLVTLPLKEELNDVKSFLIMRALRLFRVMRVFKLSRYSVGFKILLHTILDSVEQMRTIVFCAGISVLVFASIVYMAEGSKGKFTSIPESMWWAVQTMSSVGYGDIVPITPIGRFFGSLCAVSGILLFCLPTPILVTNFLKHYMRAFLSANSSKNLSEQQKQLVENMKKIYLSSNR